LRPINLETWPRRALFKVYNALDNPHFNMCANVDLTDFYPVVKQGGLSFTVGIMYVLARAGNAIPEFRYRIRAGEVVEHETVHPSTTILTNEDLFTFCPLDFTEDFSLFAARAAQKFAYMQENPMIENEPGKDDMLYMTSIPWVSFTSFMHPLHLHPVDSVPRFAWGKFFGDGERLKMPLSVQGHHALMDGIHMGRFYEKVQDLFSHPGFIQGEA